MRVTPTRALLAALGAGVAVALPAVALPALTPALAAGWALLLALLLLDLAAWRREPSLRVRRELPERAHVGCASRVVVVLENPAGRPVRAELYEALPADLSADRLAVPDVRVPARGRVRVAWGIRPSTRGDRPLGRVEALSHSPLGLLRRRELGAAGETLRVYPDATRFLAREALDPRRMLELLGVRPARERGEGLEFESMRDYVPGDDPRRVDWAASARRGRPVVRQHQHERRHVLVVALDASRLMASRIEGRTKLDLAIDAALALAYAGLVAGDRVALALFDSDLRGFLPPRRRRHDLGDLLEFVRVAQPRLVECDCRALLEGLDRRQRQRALVVVLTDFLEPDARTFLSPLAVLARRHRLLLAAVRDPLFDELDARVRDGRPIAPYRRLVLDDLLLERERALLALRRRGVDTLDLPPREITAPVLNRYLALRHGGEV